ncbi:MFS transporter [Microbacterium sp. BWT-B31]|uniref:MFS transporter n=1 Tax=Microbacterium sp. BWT-B31 TaxID=3232072 RepID=UPI003529D32E
MNTHACGSSSGDQENQGSTSHRPRNQLKVTRSRGWIAALWVLSAIAWSLVIPVQQAVIAEAAGSTHLGRGLSLYEAAVLAGAFVGSLAAGLLYDSGSWLIACIVCAIVIASGAALIPAAVRHLGVTDHPTPAPAAARAEPQPTQLKPDPEAVDGHGEPHASESKPEKSRQKLLTDFAAHSGLLALAILISWAVVPGFSFASILGIGDETPDVFGAVRVLFSGNFEIAALALTGLRIWVAIYVIDLIWTAWKVLERRESEHDRGRVA